MPPRFGGTRIFGLAALFVPETLATTYGGKLDATGITVARYWGATLVPLTYVSWVAATTSGSPLKLTVTRAFEFTAIINFVVTIVAMSAGVINTTGAIVNLALSVIFHGRLRLLRVGEDGGGHHLAGSGSEAAPASTRASSTSAGCPARWCGYPS